ncbi:hypothetical protein D3C87_1245650 [compost metagenome]|jgi:hypothetical protein
MGVSLVTAVSTIIVLNGAGNAVSQEHIPFADMKQCHAYARQVLGEDVTMNNNTFVRRTAIEISLGGNSRTGSMTREIVCAVTRKV